jgi:4,5-DOPA dioxygenase extradiol
MNLSDLNKSIQNLKSTKQMPVLFIGHGSPMNGIENNQFSDKWEKLGKEIPLPQAVLCISAHWLTKGTFVTAMDFPKTIHDFSGFPQELYQVEYPAPGNPLLAEETKNIIRKTNILLDHDWGLDHGTWTIVKHMYPDANIPVLQLSIDFYKPASFHYELAKDLVSLRKKGILLIGSGNMVHNLRLVAWDKLIEPEYGYDWAIEANELFKKHINSKNHNALINYTDLSAAQLAIPTPDHYYPLLYSLALQGTDDSVEIFNDKAVGGSLTMTSVKIG